MTISGGESASYFSSIQQEYDSLIRRAVPCYEPMLEALVAYLPTNARKVLELGCGTGNLTLRILDRYPDARVTSVDVSEEMLALTRERVSERGWESRWDAARSAFEELDIPDASFDLIVSSISLHHVEDKPVLFERVRRWLREGGECWYSDQMWGATERSADHNWEHWKAFCREPGNCSEEEIAGLLEHARDHDHYEPVLAYMRAMEKAGFAPNTIDCVWRSTMWGVVGARR
ncbi:MAG: class I SAM-dependent methyltransferase [Phycisphaerales bacterium JB043]